MRPRTAPHVPLLLRAPGLLAAAGPLLLAGALPFPLETSTRWGWSGAWIYPVGDPYVAPVAAADSAGDYRVTRGVLRPAGRSGGHDGVDVANGRGGGIVRAAGNGLVVHVSRPGWNRGYGRHVVLAHRLPDGTLVYSVYAHLQGGSVAVRAREFTAAGSVIGRVGRSGRASAPHLHFEIRMPSDPYEPWQRAPAVDPLAFVAERVPTARADSSWLRPYLDWAEFAALVAAGDQRERRPVRAEWWRALLRATRHPLASAPADGDSLREALARLGLLPNGTRSDGNAPLEWDDLVLDLPGARRLGSRLPWSPVVGTERAEHSRRVFGAGAHAGDPEALAWGRPRGPSVAEMCLVLANLAGDPAPAAPPERSRSRARALTPNR